jgi:hypothetical protein
MEEGFADVKQINGLEITRMLHLRRLLDIKMTNIREM